MRIIHVSPTYFDEASIIGGGERYVHELAKFQAKLPNTEVSIFSFGSRRRDYVKDGVRYCIFKALAWRHFTLYNPFSLQHIFALRHADVIHVHQLCTFVSDIAVLASRLWKIPVFGTDHGGGGAWVLNTRLPVYRYYKKVIAQSKQATEPLLLNFKGRIEVITGGIDIDYFKPSVEAYQRHKEILFVGRLLPHKGVGLLIEAFKQLDLTCGWRLRVVGRPKDLSFFEQLKVSAKDLPIDFETSLSDEAVVEGYQRASVTVLPSMSSGEGSPAPELMGFTILESQACGTPVVCSDSGPMREFIDEGVTGWVFESGSVAALAAALQQAIADSEKDLGEVSLACRKQVEGFSWKAVSDAHLVVYQNAKKVG